MSDDMNADGTDAGSLTPRGMIGTLPGPELLYIGTDADNLTPGTDAGNLTPKRLAVVWSPWDGTVAGDVTPNRLDVVWSSSVEVGGVPAPTPQIVVRRSCRAV